MAQLWCGIDWAEKQHDVAVIDDSGSLLIKERISDDVAGFDRLVELILELRKDGLDGLPVAIETAQGLLVSAIRAAGADVFAINPLSVSRYRDRYSPSRTKSDAADAMVLANILRTDRDNHRRLPDDSEQAQSVKVLARAHQDAIWDRQQITSKARSLLHQYFPAFIETFDDLTTMGAREALRLAPTPAAAVNLRPSTMAAALRKGGRKRGVEVEARRIVAGLRLPHLRQPLQVESRWGDKRMRTHAHSRLLPRTSSHWRRPLPQHARNTPTRPYSRASQDSASFSAPGSWAKSVTIEHVSQQLAD